MCAEVEAVQVAESLKLNVMSKSRQIGKLVEL